jgi:hypothetical protein
VVTKPQNVLVLRDVHCARYVAGGNTKFFGTRLKADGTLDEFTKGNIKADVDARLGFTNDGGDYASLLCFKLTAGDLAGMSSKTAISLSDRVLPWSTGGDEGGAPSSVVTARSDYGLNTIHYGQDVAATRANEYLTAGSINNALCFLGPSRQKGLYKDGEWGLVPGQG